MSVPNKLLFGNIVALRPGVNSFFADGSISGKELPSKGCEFGLHPEGKGLMLLRSQ